MVIDFDNLREIYLSPAASAYYESLSKPLQLKIARAIELLKYPPTSRPERIIVLKSKKDQKQFVVRASNTLRILYHKIESKKILVDLIYRLHDTDWGAR
jgi:mRNA-degrading endonuclease RelE of RelBE toxin-antitoxin system